MTYTAAENRYDAIPYRRVGRSGLVLPALSLGLWHNFGDSTPIDTQRALLRTAFDLGINHFDLANNCLLYTSPSPRDGLLSRMPSSA